MKLPSMEDGEGFDEVQKFECIMRNLYELTSVDIECFRLLLESEDSLTVDEIAEDMGRDRSTAYRAVQRLKDREFVSKEKVVYDRGGYYHIYQPREIETLREKMEDRLDRQTSTLQEMIKDFESGFSQGQARSN
ncbi:MAG: helix-turn-helix domain-containing protein [Candidatus Nanohaloarchaea archaeon]